MRQLNLVRDVGILEQLIYSPFYANFFVYSIVTREKST